MEEAELSLESRINYELNKYPGIKKTVKRSYQLGMYVISPKIKSEGAIKRVSPADPKHEYFFGYYDKSPEDATGRYVLCMRADNTWRDPAPTAPAQILLIDTNKGENDPARVRVLAVTHSWNVQQGCMLQWLGPIFDREIIYNDFRDGEFCSVVLDVFSGAERVLAAPVYSVASDGTFALTLDFARLHRLRPGYGYSNLPDSTIGQKLPDAPAIWKLDLQTDTLTPLLSYTDFASFEPRPEMKNAEHKVNHIMLSPDGKRFMVLHRWFDRQRKCTRLVTVNTDGTELYNLSDDDMVSHCFWKNEKEILAFENKKGQGTGYYLMRDRTQDYQRLWPEMTSDGHPSCAPDGGLVVTDTYPNRARVASICIMRGTKTATIARVFAPFKYDNDTRCDLHPRFDRTGEKVYFDSVFEGSRGLYTVPIPVSLRKPIPQPWVSQEALVSCVIPSYKRCDTVCRAIDSALAQSYQNIEICVVDDNVPGDSYSLSLQDALKKYEGDPRVRYIAQERHVNGAVARNAGIKAAKGEFIAFLDDDDEWLPEKIEKQMAVFQANPALDGVTTLWAMYKNDTVIKTCPPYTTENFQYKILTREMSVCTPTVIIRKSSIERFGGFDGNLLRHQDLQFLVNAASESKFEVVNECLVIIHTDSEINRPDLQKIIATKKAFFHSVDSEFRKYSRKEQKRILNAHYFEVVLVAVRTKKYGAAMKYAAKVGINPQAYKDVLRRYISRKS